MAPVDPRDPNAWAELARQWQQTQSAWADWWGKSMGLAATPAPPVPASLAASDVTELNARFQSRIRALWGAAFDFKRRRQASGSRRATSRRSPLSCCRMGRSTVFALLKQSYLLYADYLRELAHLAPLPAAEKRRLEFATRQYLDAIAPTNFAATNPDVLARAVATEGASLVQGLRNLADDAQKAASR